MAKATLQQLIHQADQAIQNQQWQKAERALRKVLKQQPANVGALRQLASALGRQHQHAKAVDVCRKALQLEGDDAALHMQLAESHYELGAFNDAISTAGISIELAPTDALLRRRRANLRLKLGDPHGSCDDLQAAHEHHPDDLHTLAALVDGYIARGVIPMDDAPARLLVERQPYEAKNHARLGTTLRLNGAMDEALAAYDTALGIDRFNSNARAGKAEILVSRKQSDDAAELLRPLINSPTCSILPLQSWMRACNALERHDDAITAAERWLSLERRSPAHITSICHRLAQAYDKLDRRDEAFDAWIRANAIDSRRWDADEHSRTTDRLMSTFDAEAFESLPRSSHDTRLPVFILGMFRSGTSLTEQILSSHPQLHGAGELPDMLEIAGALPETIGTETHYPECVRDATSEQLDGLAEGYLDSLTREAGPALRCTDKLPMNYLNIGLIAMLLPRARIVHCTRDPLDTCFSCWGNPFSSRTAFTANQEALGHAYLDYLKIMEHWNDVAPLPMHTIVYEELVSDPEPVVRGMLDFLELDWHDDCLAFHESSRVARTLSMDQVSRPLTRSSIHRSRRYWDHLAPLRAVLGDLVPAHPEA
jgi:tetratricopeptide (TPR) repeat protein